MQYEQRVRELKAKGLKQLPQKGLQLDQQFALFSQWTAGKELRIYQKTSAFEALKDVMVS